MRSKTITFNRSSVSRIILILLFVIYTLTVIDFTLINDNFGRSVSSNIFSADRSTVNEYISQKINLVPFATVRLFINAYKDAHLEPHIVVENIFGNFFVFMPFAFFLPNIFKRINSFWKFFAYISAAVLIIEVLQIVFLTGSADIDDFILNVAGASVAYGVLNIPKIKRAVNKFLFGEFNEIKG